MTNYDDVGLIELETPAITSVFPTLTLNPLLVTEEQLKVLSGYSNRRALRSWLDREGIRHMVGKGGRLGCTIRALDKIDEQQSNEIEFL
ncbi:MAG: DUF4224 domain-containing protein [Gammaproteobacteria bacterium]|nr:DUF4224 domain-containing protein [Gammaproteobacteria bacterium]